MKLTLAALAAALCASAVAFAQQPASQTSAAPAPSASAPVADLFPQPNPKFFDAASPTTAEVNAFLKAIWGYDNNRTWRVEAIQKTSAPNVAKVTVFVADKSQGNKVESLRFFTTPDGKHAIADAVFNFGAHPFESTRMLMQQHADGPSRGPADKSLELVEFADLQCPHCREAQPVIHDILRDFPNAHFVYQNFPLVDIHPFAAQSAAYGNCVAQLKGNDAFFTFIDSVYTHQDSLTPELAQQTLDNAVTAAGANPGAVKACAATPAAQQKIAAQIQFAQEAGIDQTPTLVINGHLVPIGSVPYETLKQIITWDAQQSGATTATPAR